MKMAVPVPAVPSVSTRKVLARQSVHRVPLLRRQAWQGENRRWIASATKAIPGQMVGPPAQHAKKVNTRNTSAQPSARHVQQGRAHRLEVTTARTANAIRGSQVPTEVPA